jgi:hypothetical protein
MNYDEALITLNMTDNEKIIVEYFFKGTCGQDLQQNLPLMIRADDRIWFDSCSGTGIRPQTIINYLRKQQPTSFFEDAEMFECRFHIGTLPSDLFEIALNILDNMTHK